MIIIDIINYEELTEPPEEDEPESSEEIDRQTRILQKQVVAIDGKIITQ